MSRYTNLVAVALGAGTRRRIVSIVAVLTVALGLFGLSLYTNRNAFSDDAYISFHYSQMLSRGEGLVYNTEQGPTEGYTNFLLVLALAPFLKLGADPLLVTRAMSILAALGLAAACALWCRYRGLSFTLQITAASMALVTGNIGLLSMTGLETLLYTVALFGAFAITEGYWATRRLVYLRSASIVAFAAFLLRPEALLLLGVVVLVTLGDGWSKGQSSIDRERGFLTVLRRSLIPVANVMLPFLCLALPYVVWKQFYFGSIFPLPYFLKGSSGSLFSPLGIESVRTFYMGVLPLLCVISCSMCYLLYMHLQHRKKGGDAKSNAPLAKADLSQAGLVVAGLLVACHTGFYLHIDTLIDIGGRFMYPMTPFILVVAVACAESAFRVANRSRGFMHSQEQWRAHHPYRSVALPMLVAVLASSVFQGSLRDDMSLVLSGRGAYQADERSASTGEYRFATLLGDYPYIQELRIAFGDAGAISYLTRANVIDVVGLNDRYIAHERATAKLLDYLFNQHPTIMMIPAIGHNWLKRGHGPLGNYAAWMDDYRWNTYDYAGTVVTDFYDVHVFVDRDYSRAPELTSYLRTIVDLYIDDFNLPYGDGQSASVKRY
jgi:hypothetical protein